MVTIAFLGHGRTFPVSFKRGVRFGTPSYRFRSVKADARCTKAKVVGARYMPPTHCIRRLQFGKTLGAMTSREIPRKTAKRQKTEQKNEDLADFYHTATERFAMHVIPKINRIRSPGVFECVVRALSPSEDSAAQAILVGRLDVYIHHRHYLIYLCNLLAWHERHRDVRLTWRAIAEPVGIHPFRQQYDVATTALSESERLRSTDELVDAMVHHTQVRPLADLVSEAGLLYRSIMQRRHTGAQAPYHLFLDTVLPSLKPVPDAPLDILWNEWVRLSNPNYDDWCAIVTLAQTSVTSWWSKMNRAKERVEWEWNDLLAHKKIDYQDEIEAATERVAESWQRVQEAERRVVVPHVRAAVVPEVHLRALVRASELMDVTLECHPTKTPTSFRQWVEWVDAQLVRVELERVQWLGISGPETN